MFINRTRSIAWVTVVTVLALSSCGGSDGDTAAEGTETSSELASAIERADDAEAERDDLAAEVARLQDELDSANQTTTDTAPTSASTDPPVDTEPPVAAPGPKAPDASPYVTAFGDMSTVVIGEGAPGEVSVVATAAGLDRSGSLTVVVRNNTDANVGRIELSGTARDAAGTLVGSGSDQGISPSVVAPGEIAYGYVYFGSDVPADALFEISVSSDARSSKVPVAITEVSLVGDSLVGIVNNDGDTEVSGPIGVDGVCFAADGSVSGNFGAFTEQDTLTPGASGSFSTDFYGEADQCQRGLISASGFDF